MALVTNIQEIQSVIPFATYSDVDAIKPVFNTVEAEYVLPVLGSATLALLQADYPGLSTPKWAALHAKVLPVLVNIGMLQVLPQLNTKMSSGGMKKNISQDEESIKMWEFNKLCATLSDAGNRAIDALYAFLEANKATYTEWAASDNFSEFKKYFINTTDEFHTHVSINKSRQTFLRLVPQMELVEELHIKPEIGSAFYDDLKAKIKTGTLSAAEKVIVRLIQKIVAIRTAANSINELGFNIKSNGLVAYPRLYNDTVTEDAPSIETIREYNRNGLAQADQLTNLLKSTLAAQASVSVFIPYYNFLNSKDEVVNYNTLAKGTFRI